MFATTVILVLLYKIGFIKQIENSAHVLPGQSRTVVRRDEQKIGENHQQEGGHDPPHSTNVNADAQRRNTSGVDRRHKLTRYRMRLSADYCRRPAGPSAVFIVVLFKSPATHTSATQYFLRLVFVSWCIPHSSIRYIHPLDIKRFKLNSHLKPPFIWVNTVT